MFKDLKEYYFQSIIPVFVFYKQLFISPTAYYFMLHIGWRAILGFFLTTHIVVAALFTTQIKIHIIPTFLSDIHAATTQIELVLPDDLIVDWNTRNDTVRFLQQNDMIAEPITVPFDSVSSLKTIQNFMYPPDPQYILSLNNDHGSKDMYQSAVTFQSDAVIIQDADFGSFPFAYAVFPQFKDSFTVDKDFVIAYVRQSIDSFATASQTPLFMIGLFLVTIPLSLMITSFAILIDGLFLVLLMRIQGALLTTRETFQMTFLFASVATVIEQITNLLYPALSFPMYSIAFWVIAVYVLFLNRSIRLIRLPQ